MTMSRY